MSKFLSQLRYFAWFVSTSLVVALGAFIAGRRDAERNQAKRQTQSMNQASKQVRHVKENIDAMDDAAVREHAKRWVRNK